MSRAITNKTYLNALVQLKQTYADLPWYQRLWFGLCSWSLWSALDEVDTVIPTVEQVNRLLKCSEEAWFFNAIFGLLDAFKQLTQELSFIEPVDNCAVIPTKSRDVNFEMKYQQTPERPIKLHSELLERIAEELPLKDLPSLLVSRATYFLFQPKINVRLFLSAVVHGDYDKVAEVLMDNINFLLDKGQVTDCSGRTFFNISGFQYALWALDKHMWIRMPGQNHTLLTS